MNKLDILEFAIAEEEKKLEQLVSHEDWGNANRKAGYIEGLRSSIIFTDCPNHGNYGKDKVAQVLSNFSNTCYGEADYWTAWLSGWEVAKNIIGD